MATKEKKPETQIGQSLVDLLLARRSAGRVLPERPPRELIERLIEAGCAAPNHHLTQPWRFVVIAGEARREMGHALRAALEGRLADPAAPSPRPAAPAASQALLSKEENKLLRAPVIIVVAVQPSSDPRAIPQEEVASGVAAAQNILLAAQALGLGAMWRTGETAYDPRVAAALGLPADHQIVGFIYVGYPDPSQPPPPRPPRRSPAEVTRWWGWEE